MIEQGIPGILWKFKSELALLAACLLAFGLSKDNEALRAALAAKPKIETRIETKTVKGPVRIVEKIVTTPGGERIVERVVTRDAVTRETIAAHNETPACVAPYVPRFLIGASANPFRSQDGIMLRGGYTVNGRLDLSYGHSITGKDERHEIATALRF
jgi:hypothetical protein